MPEHDSAPCTYCDGEGCSECGQTGQRFTTAIDAGDGASAIVHGNAELTPKSLAALSEVVRAAQKQLDADRLSRPATGGLLSQTCPHCGREI